MQTTFNEVLDTKTNSKQNKKSYNSNIDDGELDDSSRNKLNVIYFCNILEYEGRIS